ncbi:Uncharacterized protein FWK35_00019170, partial [Aphis craccivora]
LKSLPRKTSPLVPRHNPKYRERPLQVLEVLPGDTYRVAELATDSKVLPRLTCYKRLKRKEVNSKMKTDLKLRHKRSRRLNTLTDASSAGKIRTVRGKDKTTTSATLRVSVILCDPVITVKGKYKFYRKGLINVSRWKD